MIPFNKPHLSGNEILHLQELFSDAVQFSGNGKYTKLCHQFFKKTYDIKHCLLTSSCTDALEMAAILTDIMPGDEVIMPSYTFVSTANAFLLRGATIRFADSLPEHPNVDPSSIESLITPKTKVIVVVHYAGIACDMNRIMDLCHKNNIFCVEDAAQGIGAKYKGKLLGTIGDLGTYSFHETKNIISGEGGLLIVNNESMIKRSEIIWEKGTNRSAFFRGEVDKYSWVDIGSSFLPSELTAAFLYGQLENVELILGRRLELWSRYFKNISTKISSNSILLPTNPTETSNNGHIFYLICKDISQRNRLIDYLRVNKIHAVFHYLPLHSSTFFMKQNNYEIAQLENCDRFSNCLVRLPLFFDLKLEEVDYISQKVIDFFDSEK